MIGKQGTNIGYGRSYNNYHKKYHPLVQQVKI